MLPKSTNEDCLDKKAVQTAETLEVEDDCNTSVCGRCSSADGCNTSSSGECSHAEGCGSKALGDCSHAEGSNTRALENNSHAEGCSTRAIGNCSHAEGSNTIAYSDSSHTEGLNTKTRGNYAHGEGNGNEANGESSHAQGVGTKAEGYASSSEGGYTTVRGSYAHAEGYSTTVNGYYSHAEGVYTTATGNYSHAEGYSCLTEGYGSHAEGYYTSARAPFSHSEGYYTDTKLNTGSHIMGIYGEADTPYSWFLGGGTSNLKALAAKILYTGDGYIRNAWHAGGSGYAEVYPGLGGQTIDPGYFVTLEGEFIRKAKDSDKFVLGVTSVNPAFVASSSELNLGSNFLTNAWNQTLYEDNLVPEKTDTEGNVTEPAHVIKQPMQKLQSSVTAQAAASCQDSISSLVTLLGQVLVLDDGTCEPNGYCWPNKDGIATTSSFGYRVMKRVSDNQVLIFFRG